MEPKDSDSEDEQGDIVDFLDKEEALELVEFNLHVTMTPKNTWEPPKPTVSFLPNNMNRSLSEDERESIMKDFPKLDCDILTASKFDKQVKKHP